MIISRRVHGKPFEPTPPLSTFANGLTSSGIHEQVRGPSVAERTIHMRSNVGVRVVVLGLLFPLIGAAAISGPIDASQIPANVGRPPAQ